MPAITIQDLNNAKVDVDHIADIATSLAATAVDRLGHTKLTVAGAIATIAAITNRGAWTAATTYYPKDLVLVSGTWYICVVAHVSSASFATDQATDWRVYQGAQLSDVTAVRTDFAAATGASLVGYDGPGANVKASLDLIFNKFGQAVNIKDAPYNAVGNGVADDSAAFNAAYAFAKANRRAVRFPAGTYNLPSTNVMSGRVTLVGDGDVLLVGNLSYVDTFPTVADVTAPVNDTIPFLTIRNLNFSSASTSLFALSIKANSPAGFIDCLDIQGAKFYGMNGMLAQDLIGTNLTDVWFYSNRKGLRAEGCTNWSFVGCRWRNQIQYGCDIASVTTRLGGENFKFVNCEWAVCATGLRGVQAAWMSFENCLFDYCILPVEGYGCDFMKFTNTYLGVSTQGSLQGQTGYQAPPTSGTAVYLHPFVDASNNVSPAGATFFNCEVAGYNPGATQPILYAEGNIAALPSVFGINRLSLHGMKFVYASAHSATYAMRVNKVQQFEQSFSEYISPNLSSTLLEPYSVSNYSAFASHDTSTLNFIQSGVEVKSTMEYIKLDQVRMVRDSAGFNILNSSGQVTLSVAGAGNGRVSGWFNGSLQLIGVGAVNSAGTGYRQLIIPN